MKIENVNVEQFLKEDKMVINRERSLELTKNSPSIKRKHIKNEKKVGKALLELETKHDWSWYDEIKYRYQKHMNKPMVYYRGTEKTGVEVFQKADQLAASFRQIGLEKGEEILVCMSNVPEFLTVLLAASKCGLKVVSFGSNFDPEFIKKIVAENKKKIFIGTDDQYGKIADIIEQYEIKQKILISLTDSLKDGKDPYKEYDDKFYKFQNKVYDFKKKDKTIQTLSEFLKVGKNYTGKYPKVNLYDDFTITFTSGSTKIGWPKAMIHRNIHYIAMGRFHDPDLSRMPAMRNMRGLAHIPTHSNTDIASSISDTLCQTCTVAFEPIYHKDFLAYSLQINKPGFVPATRSHLLSALKQYDSDPKLKEKNLEFLLNVVAVGEETSKNEEKFCNQKFKELKAGSKVIPKPLSPITLSVGGGNCEHGGLFFTLFKALREKVSFSKSLREDFGLMPFQLTELAVLREDGSECDYEEIGTLVANSPITMKEYKNNEEATKAFYRYDCYGRKWGNCNVWAYVANNGNVVMKGRKDSEIELSTGHKIPNFLIANNILKEENILSCEVVTVKDEEDSDVAVAHIQFHPDTKENWENMKKTLEKIERRSQACFSEELCTKIMYRIRTEEEGYPLTGSGKRSIKQLEEEGISKTCIKPVQLAEDSNFSYLSATEYLKMQKEKKNSSLTKAPTLVKKVKV